MLLKDPAEMVFADVAQLAQFVNRYGRGIVAEYFLAEQGQ